MGGGGGEIDQEFTGEGSGEQGRADGGEGKGASENQQNARNSTKARTKQSLCSPLDLLGVERAEAGDRLGLGGGGGRVGAARGDCAEGGSRHSLRKRSTRASDDTEG